MMQTIDNKKINRLYGYWRGVCICMVGAAASLLLSLPASALNTHEKAGLSEYAIAQIEKKVTGRVIDRTGEAVIGASVVVKDSKAGVVTDIDGNFVIDAPDNATLIVTFIGYKKQEVSLKGRTNVVITMQDDSQMLEEVVAVGYGSVKKSNLTSSVSKITNEALENRPVTNLSEGMQGQLAGVNVQATSGGLPGQELTMRIRGVNTINGDSSPLYVIDGVPRDNMNDINPSDIATIQILKDASATAIYGSRGANGVVLIETKTGKGKPQVSFNAYYGLQTAEKKVDLMSGPEWVAYTIYRRNADYMMSGGSMSDPMSSRPEAYRIPDWWTTTTEFTDWQSEVLRTAPIQSYEASASADGDIGNIFLSIGYTSQDGIVRYTDFSRYNVRLNATLNLLKNLKIGGNFAFSSSKQNLADTNGGDENGKDSPLHHAMMMSPLVPLGSAIRTASNPNGTLESTQSSSDYGEYWIDPLAQMANTTDQTNRNNVQTSVWGEWNIIPELTYKIQFSNDYEGYSYEYFQPATVNRKAYRNSGSSKSSHTTEWVLQNTLTYENQFGDHNLNVLLGQSAEKQKYYLGRMTATGWPYESVSTLNQATTPTLASTERTTYANASFFGRLSYNYKERYLLTASVRRDGSSRFGIDSKWGTFPSFSAGWKISEEDFMKSVYWVNLLKLRVSYGTSGNDRIGDFVYLSQLSQYNAAFGETLQTGAAASNIANPNLKWEQTKSFDIGLDFSAFHNRLQFNFDYYVNTTSNLLFDVPIPYTTGFESTWTNIGKIRNKGWEIDITSHNIDTGDFRWNSNLNLSHNSNEVLELSSGQTKIITNRWDAYFITQVGGAVSEFYDYVYEGFLTAEDIANPNVVKQSGATEGHPKIKNVTPDGVINGDDRVPSGTNLPDITFGFTNRFSYKNLELSFLLQGQFGGQIQFLGARHTDCGFSGRNQYDRWLTCYKPEELAAAIPTDYISKYGIDMGWDDKTPNPINWPILNNRYSSDYVRVKNITLSYTFPKSLLAKTPFTSVRIYGSVDNVYTFTDYPGYTPETSSFGNGTTQLGVDYSTYPLSRRFTLGANITL